jgi:hypothetical protein
MAHNAPRQSVPFFSISGSFFVQFNLCVGPLAKMILLVKQLQLYRKAKLVVILDVHLFSYLYSSQDTKDVQAQGAERDSRAVRFNFESKDQNPSFKDLVRSDVSESPEGAETQISQEPLTEWGPEGPPDLASGLEEGNLPYPYLPTVLEEPNSSFSEGLAYFDLCNFLLRILWF